MATATTDQPRTALHTQLHVLHALMLRDMRTRFGGSHWGYVVAVLWPCFHIFTLVAIMGLRGLPTPIGDSVILFISTGAIPYVTFMYMTRKIMDASFANKPLTYFPVVTLQDVILSRTIVEIISACATTAAVFVVLLCLQVDVVPYDMPQAIFAFAATIIVSAGLGMLNANIVLFFPGWAMGYVLVIIGGYSISGVFFLPDYMPAKAYGFFSWNPMLQCISWFRSAFYPGYGENVAKIYTISVGLVMVLCALALERFSTRKRT